MFSLFKLVRKSISLVMSNLSTSAFKTIKPFLAAKSDVSALVACSNSFLVASFDKSNTTLTLSLI